MVSLRGRLSQFVLTSPRQLLREVVEPLPNDWSRSIALTELGQLIRERGRDVGVNMDEVGVPSHFT